MSATRPTSSGMLSRAYYADLIEDFLARSDAEIAGLLALRSEFSVETTQRDAWMGEVAVLRRALAPYAREGKVYFEFGVPRMGRRIDVVAVIRNAVFVIEFKVGEREFTTTATDQVCDYALDLKNFHETSHDKLIAPIVVATEAPQSSIGVAFTAKNDGVLLPIFAAPNDLGVVIQRVLAFQPSAAIGLQEWEAGRYSPTPTIIEAAMALYGGHGVDEISRSDASAINLQETSDAISAIVTESRDERRKAVCFVTGVPGAGKTLVGLNIATQHIDPAGELYSVFLSGNGPLVAVLREALARDRVRREKELGRPMKRGAARSEVKAFIQNVHHFRDDCLLDTARPPVEHVALFDEAQRAWNVQRTADFMKRKKGRAGFEQSEPEFLLSCMDRHPDWAVVVCLVGGGQEINTGEAGIGEWIESVQRSFPDWHVYVSPRLQDSEYGAGMVLEQLKERADVHWNENLHLAVSMRSFRAEQVSALVKRLLDLEFAASRGLLSEIGPRYPIVLTRDLSRAKSWLRSQARGTERYGIVVSSEAQRLKPHAIDVRTPMDPIHWFLDPKADVRSSYYMEDVATEFHVQGLELDWAGVVWDGDFRFDPGGWKHHSFVGDKWQRINRSERQTYLKNAYRVLLTRARQGMVIVVPEGDREDPTRDPTFYDPTFEYLKGLGMQLV